MEQHERISGRRSLPTAKALHRLGDVLRRVEQYDEAYTLLSEALETRRQLIDGDSYEIADSYNNLAILAAVMGRYRESEELQTASVEMDTRLFGPEAVQLATPLNNLALLKRRQGKIAESLELSRRSHEILSRSTDRSSDLLARVGMARSMQLAGDLVGARSVFEQVVAEQTRLLGRTHTRRLSTMLSLAAVEIEMGRYDDASERLAELERVTLESQGERSTSYARWLHARAVLDRHLGDLSAAETRARRAAEIHEERTGARHYRLPVLWLTHGAILADLGRYVEAESVLQRALSRLPAGAEYPHVVRARVLNELARVWRLEGRNDDAAGALEESRAIIDATVGPASIEDGTWWLETAFHEAQDDDASAAAIDRAAAILGPRLPDRDPMAVALRDARARLGR